MPCSSREAQALGRVNLGQEGNAGAREESRVRVGLEGK